MYERFTDEARDAILGAQVEARALAHDHVGTEHLLLGVLDLPGRGVLAELGVTLDGARAEVQRLVSGPETGLSDDDVEALRSIGIDVDEIRRRVEETFGPGALDAPVRRPPAESRSFGPPFTPEAKHALEGALRESLQLGHREIGADHLVLALAASGGLAADILRNLGADPTEVRTRVLARMGRAA
ncbi:MAG TPA: Clp protease N-terminal domain-containing protein [Acidimicrobiales bacterium]|jgi:ATP-dependent Clp protease ATP-binding subunit ClpA